MMQPKEAINDFVIKFANVNGTGSASANGMFAKAIFRMGVPVVVALVVSMVVAMAVFRLHDPIKPPDRPRREKPPTRSSTSTRSPAPHGVPTRRHRPYRWSTRRCTFVPRVGERVTT